MVFLLIDPYSIDNGKPLSRDCIRSPLINPPVPRAEPYALTLSHLQLTPKKERIPSSRRWPIQLNAWEISMAFCRCYLNGRRRQLHIWRTALKWTEELTDGIFTQVCIGARSRGNSVPLFYKDLREITYSSLRRVREYTGKQVTVRIE